MTINVAIGGEVVQVLADKALYWPREKTLFVADVHFGKAAALRASAVPLPPGSTTATLTRLQQAVQTTGAERVVFLGDFLHNQDARAAETFARIADWRIAHRFLALTLVRGNHDLKAGDPPGEWGIDCVEEGHQLGPFCLAHHPQADLRGYVLAGHVHPAVRLRGPAGDRLTLPCFWFGPYVCVLPAFGSFTGTWTVHPRSGDRVMVVVDGTLLELSSTQAGDATETTTRVRDV